MKQVVFFKKVENGKTIIRAYVDAIGGEEVIIEQIGSRHHEFEALKKALHSALVVAKVTQGEKIIMEFDVADLAAVNGGHAFGITHGGILQPHFMGQ